MNVVGFIQKPELYFQKAKQYIMGKKIWDRLCDLMSNVWDDTDCFLWQERL